MRIVYIGNFEPRHSTENHLASTLEMLGHEVVREQENKRTAEQVAVDAKGAGFLMWTRTWGIEGNARAMLEGLGCPSVAYHLDLYAGLNRGLRIKDEPWWGCSLVCTADGGSEEYWQARGINHFWFPPGVYEPECYLAEPGPTKHDVIFVGSKPYHSEWPWRPQLIEWLHDTYGHRFAHYGNGSPVSCIRNEELNELYASSKVVVGDSLCLNYTHPRYWSDRIPETLGRGGFLLHPKVPGLEGHYIDGEHLATFDYGDLAGLKQQIDYYLRADGEREEIRAAGHTHVKAHHTYTQRMQMLIELVTE